MYDTALAYVAYGPQVNSKLLPSAAITFSDRTPFLEREDKWHFIGSASKMFPGKRLFAKELYNNPCLMFNPEL